MRMREIPRQGIEVARTAPMGALWIAGAVGVDVSEVAQKGPEMFLDAGEDFLVASTLLMIMVGAFKVIKQYQLRRRLENSIQQHGFDERAFSGTTMFYCDRQTARVVCGHTGHLDEYKQMAKSQRAKYCTFIPHI